MWLFAVRLEGGSESSVGEHEGGVGGEGAHLAVQWRNRASASLLQDGVQFRGLRELGLQEASDRTQPMSVGRKGVLEGSDKQLARGPYVSALSLVLSHVRNATVAMPTEALPPQAACQLLRWL